MMALHVAFFYLLLILLPTQLGLHFWPSWAMVLGRRVDFLSPTIYLTDILVVLLLIFWFKNIPFKFNRASWRIKFLIKQKKFQLTILLLGFIFLNIFFAGNRLVAIYGWVKILEYVLLGVYILKTRPKISTVAFFLSVGVAYSSILAIVQFFLQRSVGGPLWFLGERTFSNLSPGIAQFNVCNPFTYGCALVLRAYGTFPHPNVLGGFLAVSLPLLLYQWRNDAAFSHNKKIYYVSAMCVGAVALVLTFSRSAWVAALLGLGMVFYASSQKRARAVPIVIVTIIMLVLVGRSVGLQDESVVVREALNSSAVKMFRQSPIIGKGVNDFLVELPHSLPSRQIYFLQPVHNIYLLVLAETGIVGFVIVTWIVWKAVGSELRCMVYEPWKKQNREKFIIHNSLIIILLLGLVDHYPLTLQQGQLMVTILLSLALIR